eukprot:5921612-Alexandrium_andersonii.AAC.1
MHPSGAPRTTFEVVLGAAQFQFRTPEAVSAFCNERRRYSVRSSGGSSWPRANGQERFQRLEQR